MPAERGAAVVWAECDTDMQCVSTLFIEKLNKFNNHKKNVTRRARVDINDFAGYSLVATHLAAIGC